MRGWMALLVLAAGGLAACAGGPESEERERRIVLVDGGDAGVLGLAPVVVGAAPGDDVVVRNANTARGRTEGSGHVLFASPAGAVPPLFASGPGGAAPNGALWGQCRGGTAREGQLGCPVPPVEGPQRWDGTVFWSLGDLLPGEERVLPLADDISPGDYRFWCGKHPGLSVDVRVGEGTLQDQVAAPPPQGAAAVPPNGAGTVLVAPDSSAPAAEVLSFVPARLAVPVGGSVTWQVDGPAPHSVELGSDAPALLDGSPSSALPVAPADRLWDGAAPVSSGWLGTDGSAPGGERFSLTFLSAGTYRYACRFHPGMTGEIVVG